MAAPSKKWWCWVKRTGPVDGVEAGEKNPKDPAAARNGWLLDDLEIK
jgi:hypothetical protein